MNDGDFLAAVGPGVIEGVPTEALRVLFRHDLQALDDARDVLVLQHGVLALSVLSQRGKMGISEAEAVAKQIKVVTKQAFSFRSKPKNQVF